MTALSFYRIDKKPPVAWVYLNRPEKKNAMNAPAWTETLAIFEDLDSDDAIRVVVVAGEGDCFSAGIDMMAMAAQMPEMQDAQQKGGIKRSLLKKIAALQDGISCVAWCRKPVIAAVHGYCLGAGLDLASACDLRLCSADAIFCLKEAAVGFVADVGVLQRLPHIIGQGMTRELAFSAANIDAQRALQMMLVNRIYDDKQALFAGAQKLAEEIAANSPLAVQASKQVLNHGIGQSIEAGLQYVASISANTIPSDDLTEAMLAFKQKRKPQFSGR